MGEPCGSDAATCVSASASNAPSVLSFPKGLQSPAPARKDLDAAPKDSKDSEIEHARDRDAASKDARIVLPTCSTANLE